MIFLLFLPVCVFALDWKISESCLENWNFFCGEKSIILFNLNNYLEIFTSFVCVCVVLKVLQVLVHVSFRFFSFNLVGQFGCTLWRRAPIENRLNPVCVCVCVCALVFLFALIQFLLLLLLFFTNKYIKIKR